jgi:predicted RNA binding protein YcfA (HicA-like mRNA interferase family)
MPTGAVAGLSPQEASVSGMKVSEVLQVLEKDGWILVRTRGRHRQYAHPNKAGLVTVAGKRSLEIPTGTPNSILKQAQLKD